MPRANSPTPPDARDTGHGGTPRTKPHAGAAGPRNGSAPMHDGMPGMQEHMQGHMRGDMQGRMSYGRFAAMIATSTVVMYGLMFSTALQLDHVWFSQTRFWMALYMGATMAVIMLAFMRGMYADGRTNAAIFGGAALVFAGALFLARSQRTVGDVAWMKGMIPHHSIAILTSERARITDPRVRKLADDIIAAQRREIGEMEGLIADLERSPAR